VKRYRVAEGKTLTRGDNTKFEAGAVLPESAFAKIDIGSLVDGGFLEEIPDPEEEE